MKLKTTLRETLQSNNKLYLFLRKKRCYSASFLQLMPQKLNSVGSVPIGAERVRRKNEEKEKTLQTGKTKRRRSHVGEGKQKG